MIYNFMSLRSSPTMNPAKRYLFCLMALLFALNIGCGGGGSDASTPRDDAGHRDVENTRDASDASDPSSCESLCTPPPNARVSSCADGVCVYQCEPGFIDPNGDLQAPGSPGCNIECEETNGGVEICDGLDNNCNGQVDEGFDLQSDVQNCGACATVCTASSGTPVCVNGECGVDTCAPGFADCDGQAANGCEVRTDTDPQNCGGCGIVCDPANGTGACEQGTCVLAACDAGFDDCDQDPTNGCEADLSSVATCASCTNACAPAAGTTLGSACEPQSGSYQCVCVDDGVEYCDGVQNICGDAPDLDCPGTLDLSKPSETSSPYSNLALSEHAGSGSTLQSANCPSGNCSGSSHHHILDRLVIKHDKNGIHQILPYWYTGFHLRAPASGAAAGSDYPSYQIEPVASLPSSQVLGVADGNYNTASPRFKGPAQTTSVECSQGSQDTNNDGAYEQLSVMIGLNVYFADCGEYRDERPANSCTDPNGCNFCGEALTYYPSAPPAERWKVQDPIVGLQAVCRKIQVRNISADTSLAPVQRYQLEFVGNIFSGTSAGITTGRAESLPMNLDEANQGPITSLLARTVTSAYPRDFISGTRAAVWTFYGLGIGISKLQNNGAIIQP